MRDGWLKCSSITVESRTDGIVVLRLGTDGGSLIVSVELTQKAALDLADVVLSAVDRSLAAVMP